MTTSYSVQSESLHDLLSSRMGFKAFILFGAVWVPLAIMLVWAHEAWFDPWDVMHPPAAGTTAAMLHPLIKEPLFFAFSAFALGGSVLLAGWKLLVSAEKLSTIHRIAKAQSAGLIAFICLMIISSLPVANLWSDITNLSYRQYINYNHYIRTGPFIVLALTIFGLQFWRVWRIK